MDNFIADLANFAKFVNSKEKTIGELFIDFVKQHDKVDELDELGYCKATALMSIGMGFSRSLSMAEADDIEEEILDAESIEEIHQIEEEYQ